MDSWRLELGPDPWTQLAAGKVLGNLVESDRSIPVAVRIRGAHSRRFPKRSLQVDLAEPFPDGPPDGHTIRRLHLNADYIDPTLMRSRLSFWLFETMGVPAPQHRYIDLLVNGEPAGIYVGLESVDDDFCRRRGWAVGPIFYAVNRNANFGLVSPFTRSLKEPLEAGYKRTGRADKTVLRPMLMDLNLATEGELLQAVERWIEVDIYLRWLLVAVFVGNRDGFVHNYALYRSPETGRFTLIPWDYDATWGVDIHGRRARVDRVPITGWNKLTHRLLANDGCRRRYQQLVRGALRGNLSLPVIEGEIDRLLDEQGSAIGNLDEEVAYLRRWAEQRHRLLSEQVAQLG
jgi:spore coat protein H